MLPILLDLFLFYVSLVFGFQHAEIGASLINALAVTSNPREVEVYGFCVTAIGFFLLIYIIRRVLFPDHYEIGCFSFLVAAGVLLWFVSVIVIKSNVYLTGPAQGISPNAISNEQIFDALIQFWFFPEHKYFLFGVVANLGVIP